MAARQGVLAAILAFVVIAAPAEATIRTGSIDDRASDTTGGTAGHDILQAAAASDDVSGTAALAMRFAGAPAATAFVSGAFGTRQGDGTRRQGARRSPEEQLGDGRRRRAAPGQGRGDGRRWRAPGGGSFAGESPVDGRAGLRRRIDGVGARVNEEEKRQRRDLKTAKRPFVPVGNTNRYKRSL